MAQGKTQGAAGGTVCTARADLGLQEHVKERVGCVGDHEVELCFLHGLQLPAMASRDVHGAEAAAVASATGPIAAAHSSTRRTAYVAARGDVGPLRSASGPTR